MGLTESINDMQVRIAMELMVHRGDCLCIGGFDQPTMLDFPVFQNFVWGYMFGLKENLSTVQSPIIKAWLKHTADHLPPNPTLVHDEMLIKPLALAFQ